jgi:hypothetical protein
VWRFAETTFRPFSPSLLDARHYLHFFGATSLSSNIASSTDTLGRMVAIPDSPMAVAKPTTRTPLSVLKFPFPQSLRLPRETLSAILTNVFFARNNDSDSNCPRESDSKNSVRERGADNYAKTLTRFPIHVIAKHFFAPWTSYLSDTLTISTLSAMTT